ncbi:NlpC/P60 family protein [Kocuria aegyptia]|uniref:NlpC/P60 domain-containing protein n=1 Tax=Kocuria aegyptia TaxID=330943 RepID=A0ABN2KRY3_9MICC
MPVFQSRTPRHRAESSFRLGRTAILTAAAGALTLSSVAPAQAAPAATPQQLVSIQSQSSKAATIAAAAKNQLGVVQDCTALVTKALRAAGINHHGWPASYLSLGTRVSAAQAQPGDLVYYANGGMGFAHIAVYIGGGKAVHGGWNGNQTVIQTVHVGSGPVYIRVR